MEQTVDIPVPGRGGRSSGLQGFLSGQGSTALLSSGERISERTVEQTIDPPGGGLQDFRPGLSSSSSYFPAGVPEALDEPGPGVIRTFPQIKKKCEVGFALDSESPSTPLKEWFIRWWWRDGQYVDLGDN